MITMGADEFILYIRKQFPNCRTSTLNLGGSIAKWFKDRYGDAYEDHLRRDVPCYWGGIGVFINEEQLPKTAAQYTFSMTWLPELYSFLNELATRTEIEPTVSSN